MTADHLTIGAWLVASLVYFATCAVALRRRGMGDRTAALLIFYAAASGLWATYVTFGILGRLDFAGQRPTAEALPIGSLALAVLLLHLTRSFLRLEGRGAGWWAVGVVWFLGQAAAAGGLIRLPDVLWTGPGVVVMREGFLRATAVLGWGVFTGSAVFLTRLSYEGAQQGLHRNRIAYWLPVLGLTVAGDGALFAQAGALGSGLRLAATVIAALVVLTHRLPDVRLIARRTASYVLITLLTVIIYAAGFVATQAIFHSAPGYDPIASGAVLALILAVLFNPLLEVTQRLANRVISGTGYDPGRTLRQYSHSISHILRLNRLAKAAVSIAGDALGVEQGHLFVVDRPADGGPNSYSLRGAGGVAVEEPATMSLADDSPIAACLSQERRPLTQYDIDLLPRFRKAPPPELAWFSGLAMEVFVPIYAHGEWIGLLALGPKTSRDRFFEEDLALLSTLADQTAVALENARLVDNLVVVNTELGQAYAALEKANQQLQEMDKLKSSFIGVITHELRTPFANIMFSLQLVERYGLDQLPAPQREQLEQMASAIRSLKVMVDNLVTFAAFLSKQGELRLSRIDFRTTVHEALLPLRSLAEGKEIEIYDEMGDDLPPLHGDKGRLGDAAYHLVHNAIKFNEPKGKVWVRCRATTDAMIFEVEDTGRGVPPDKLDSLWEGFAQMADPLRRGAEGLGLGLALVRYAVSAHSGEVYASSELNSGSTFGFRIPLAGPEQPPPAADLSKRGKIKWLDS